MFLILKGELVKKGKDPVKAIVEAIDCTDKTARNKLNGITDFTLTEAYDILDKYFTEEGFTVEDLFRQKQSTA